MKKTSIILALTLISFISQAQLQRKVTPLANRHHDTVTAGNGKRIANNGEALNRKQMMRDLNLTREQQIKLKDTRQSNREKMEVITNDDKLSTEQKEAKIRELKKAQAMNMQGILNEEQRQKMKAMREEMIKKRKMNKAEQN